MQQMYYPVLKTEHIFSVQRPFIKSFCFRVTVRNAIGSFGLRTIRQSCIKIKNKNILTGKKHLCYSKMYDYHDQIKSEGILFSTIIKNKLRCQGLCLVGNNGYQR